MIFAIIDYLSFLNQSGRFSRKHLQEPMAYGFEEYIPDKTQRILQIGDIILCASFDSWLSWVIMYYTSSLICHCAIYIGDGQIVHATLSGSVKSPIESLYGKKSRFLIARFRIPQEKLKKSKQVDISKYVNIPYSKKVVFKKFLHIVSGRDWPYFRWKFYFDVFFVFLLIDIPFLIFTRIPVFVLFPFLLFWLILINAIRWRYNPLPSYGSDWGKPCDVLNLIVKNFGILILDENRLSASDNG